MIKQHNVQDIEIHLANSITDLVEKNITKTCSNDYKKRKHSDGLSITLCSENKHKTFDVEKETEKEDRIRNKDDHRSNDKKVQRVFPLKHDQIREVLSHDAIKKPIAEANQANFIKSSEPSQQNQNLLHDSEETFRIVKVESLKTGESGKVFGGSKKDVIPYETPRSIRNEKNVLQLPSFSKYEFLSTFVDTGPIKSNNIMNTERSAFSQVFYEALLETSSKHNKAEIGNRNQLTEQRKWINKHYFVHDKHSDSRNSSLSSEAVPRPIIRHPISSIGIEKQRNTSSNPSLAEDLRYLDQRILHVDQEISLLSKNTSFEQTFSSDKPFDSPMPQNIKTDPFYIHQPKEFQKQQYEEMQQQNVFPYLQNIHQIQQSVAASNNSATNDTNLLNPFIGQKVKEEIEFKELMKQIILPRHGLRNIEKLNHETTNRQKASPKPLPLNRYNQVIPYFDIQRHTNDSLHNAHSLQSKQQLDFQKPLSNTHDVTDIQNQDTRNKKNLCHICRKKSRCLCSGCLQVWYCTKECQLSHWPSHSKGCEE